METEAEKEVESAASSLMQGQIAYLYKNTTLGIWNNIILASLFLFFFWTQLPNQQKPLLIWYGLIVTLSIVRFLTGKSFKIQKNYVQKELSYWANRYVFFTTLISTIWGVAGIMFFPEDLPHQVLLILILSSVLLSAIPTLAASKLAFYFQIVVIFLPVVSLLFLSKDQGQTLMAIAMLILCVTLVLVSTYIYHLLFELQTTHIKLKDLADTDQLTNIANRRHFDHKFKVEWRRAMREQNPISMMMIDVDFFKKYNDSYGHQEGDKCLQDIAKAMGSITNRPADLAARYGGEEFAILLPATSQKNAAMLAERLRKKIENLQIEHKRSSFGIVTVSIGISCCEPAWDFTGKTPEKDQKVIFPAMLLTAADNALYVSKEQGRNQVSEQGCGDQKLSKALQKNVEPDLTAA